MVFEELGLVDAHCHIDLFKNPREVVREANSNLVHTIAVTNAPSVYSHTEALANTSEYVWPAVGLHPELAGARKQERLQMWEALARAKFVGEIGLDYRADPSKRKIQLQIFEEILDRCAEYGDRILTVHSRRAAEDAVSAIGPNYPGSVILHWYSGTIRDLTRAVEYDFYFSVNSAMVTSKKGQRLVTAIPRNRVLTETDGPFIQLNGAPATPSSVIQTLKNLGDLWHTDLAQTTRQVMSNFRQLLAQAENVGVNVIG
jgi:TatD DNase family protein